MALRARFSCAYAAPLSLGSLTPPSFSNNRGIRLPVRPPRSQFRCMSTQAAPGAPAKPPAQVRLPENPAHWGKDGASHAAKPAGTPPAAPDGKPFGAVTIKVVGVGGGGVNTVNNMIDRGFEGTVLAIHAR